MKKTKEATLANGQSRTDKIIGFITAHKIWFIILAIAAAILLPVIVTSSYYRAIFIKTLIYALLASSLNAINGYSGQFNIGHAGFYCIGAYTYAIIATRWGVNFFVMLPVAGIAAGLAGYIISLPTLRLKGMYLAMVTMGAGEVIRLIAISWRSVTKGNNGISAIPAPSIFGYKLSSLLNYYYIILVLLIIMLFLTYRVINSRIGRAWMSIREDQNASAFLGVEIKRYKSNNFVYGAFWAGIAGCFAAAFFQYIQPELFNFTRSTEILSMVILGGQGTLVGPLLGAFTVSFLTEVLRFSDQFRLIIYAILIILMMWFRPQGLVGAKHSVLAKRLEIKKHKTPAEKKVTR